MPPWISVFFFVPSIQQSIGCPFMNYDPYESPMKTAFRAFYGSSAKFNDHDVRSLESTEEPWNPDKLQMCTPPKCRKKHLKYRTYDGTCNNLERPLNGAANQCHKRLFPHSYCDNIAEPPKRPDIAAIYEAFQSLPPIHGPSTGRPTHMLTTVIQFSAHDITGTAVTTIREDADCCELKDEEPQCSLNIDLTAATNFSNNGVYCMPFVRAARCPCAQGSTRESLNVFSSYIDLSHIYINESERDQDKPWMLPFEPDANAMLPLEAWPEDGCASNVCFRGDIRASQQQSMSFLTLVFVRLHNMIADKLRDMNRHWSNTLVFEEARRICIARWQIVFFGEAMKALADEELLRKFKLHIDDFIAGTEYDPSIDTSTLAEFVFAESRIHGLLPPQLQGEDFIWFDSKKFFTTNGTSYLKEVAKWHWTTESNNHVPFARSVAFELFKQPQNHVGLSLLMINIQRGRDVGLVDYKTALEKMYNVKIRTYDDIRQLNVSTCETVDFLEKTYENIDEIDLYVGLHTEQLFGDGNMQRTNSLIRIIQLHRLSYGDRFFWSHHNVFREEQRMALVSSSSISQIICEVLDLDEIPEDLLRFQGSQMKMKPCSCYGTIDLSPWKI